MTRLIEQESAQAEGRRLGRTDPPAAQHFVRIMNRFLHRSDGCITRETEYTIQNRTKTPMYHVFVPFPKFLVNLCIQDQGGSRLNFLGRSDYEHYLHALPPAERDHIDRLLDGVQYSVCVLFGENDPVPPGQYRSILLRWEEEESDEFEPLSHFTFKMLDIDLPTKPQQEEFFVLISAAEGYVFEAVPSDGVLKDVVEHPPFTEALAQDVFVRRPFTASVFIPPQTGHYQLRCTFLPDRRGTLITLIAAFWIALLYGVSALAAFAAFPSLASAEAGKVVAAGSGFATAGGIGLILAGGDGWLERFKALSLLPTAINAIVVLAQFLLSGAWT